MNPVSSLFPVIGLLSNTSHSAIEEPSSKSAIHFFPDKELTVLFEKFRDPNLLVELISFATTGKLQPFLVSLHTSALIVMDVHCSLTSSEVVGYLGGVWDMNNNSKLMLFYLKIRDSSVLFISINGETLLSWPEPIS